MGNAQLKERSVASPRPAAADARDILLTMLGGAPFDWSLAQIASAAAGHCGAVFTGISAAASPLPLLAFHGSPNQLLELECGWFDVIFQKALVTPGVAIIPESGRDRANGVQYTAALRLESRGAALGVLAAGFSHRPGRAEEANLRAFAALAALTLEQEQLRRAAAEAWSAHSAIVEFSTGRLLVIRRDGTVRCASAQVKAVAGITNAGPRPLLEELFPPSHRAAARLWRESLPASDHHPPPPPWEGQLASGASVRLHCLSPLAPGEWLLSMEDATERRRSETRRKTAEAELLALLDSMHEGVLLFDESSVLRLANRAFTELLQLPPGAAREGQHLGELLEALQDRFEHPAEFARRWKAIHESAREAVPGEISLRHPARSTLTRLVRPIFDADGRRVGTLELYRDAGVSAAASRVLQNQKLAMLGQLLAGVAHELNNPLTSIVGYAQRLTAGAGHPENDAQRLAEEARRAAGIVRNLLSFAHESSAQPSPTDFNQLVRSVTALRAYHWRIQSIVLDLDLHPDLPQPCLDSQKWQQVVMNLLLNAQQAIESKRGRGRITVRTRPLAGQRISLEVEDDGPGVPLQVTARIFDPFFSTKPPGEGTGLGLWIVSGIVREQGGRIVHEAVPSGGARFVVEIPLNAATALATGAKAAGEPVAEPRLAAPQAPVTGKRILVVEDEPTIAALVVDVLRDMGHTVLAITDSDDALDAALREDADFDLLICDLRMPRVDGRAFLQTLKRNHSALRNRILFLSGDTLSPRTIEFFQHNALVFLAKPFLVEELQDAVNRCWERLAASQAAPAEAAPR
jgi:signal transduction histidine kinase/ActR/RegA family two-component response regulator